MPLTQVSSGGLADDSVSAAKIATGAVTAADIPDGEITNAKIGDGEIQHDKLANDCIDGDNIQDDVVNTEHLAPNLTFTGTEGVVIPSGTTAQRNGSPTNGTFRYNTDDNVFEGRINGAWGPVGGGASGGGSDAIFYENDQNVTTNYSIASNQNAMSAGNITIDNGVSVTLESTGSGGNGARWVIV